MTDALTLAYLAGIIDADGYITVQRSLHAGRRYFGPKVGIADTRREPHDLAASVFGGKVGCYKPKNGIHLPQFQWSRSGTATNSVIEAVLPYLRIKVAQDEVAMEMQEHLEAGRCDDPFPWFGPSYDPHERSNALYMEAKSLNLRKPRAGALLDGREHREFPV